jgi:hypothetical protein
MRALGVLLGKPQLAPHFIAGRVRDQSLEQRIRYV